MLYLVGNTLYECNNWAGGMSAIYSLPGAENTPALRISCCIGYGIVVLALLFADKVNSLGVGLGLVMVAMVMLFLTVVIRLGIDGSRFGRGLLPISMPSGSANVVLSLVGTTSLGFNLFLGGTMAKDRQLSEARRGIAFSTFMAFLVSVLILIVGDGTHNKTSGTFTIASLAGIIKEKTGEVGIWIFGFGFIAAAVSSMLTVPLAAALTADSVFTLDRKQTRKCTYRSGSIRSEGLYYADEKSKNTDGSLQEGVRILPKSEEAQRPFKKNYQRMIMFVMVLISVIVISADAPTVKVILVAQVSSFLFFLYS